MSSMKSVASIRNGSSNKGSKVILNAFFQQLLGGSKKQSKGEAAAKASEIKEELLSECLRQSKVNRARVDEIIEELALYTPIKSTASSIQLQKEWELVWTTEKEINFFADAGISEKNAITQTIGGNSLTNCIPFRRGGRFGVEGTLSIPDVDGIRTEFEFSSATLDLGERWGSYRLPPVGKGWFDTVYLDDEFRVDVNSRNDILICRCR